jgi:hypothetical protein
MKVREAKDFLVAQTAEQAALEGVPLSDLEKRMMYFTENEEMPEDPLKLNDEFEAQFDSDEYEIKVSFLLHHAYARTKKENPPACSQWKEVIRTLSKGDHYVLVLWEREAHQNIFLPSSWDREPSQDLSSLSFWKLLAVAILALVVLIIAFVAYLHYGDSKPSQRNGAYLTPINFSNSSSLKIVTPNSFAFSYFDPGSVPTTT